MRSEIYNNNIEIKEVTHTDVFVMAKLSFVREVHSLTY